MTVAYFLRLTASHLRSWFLTTWKEAKMRQRLIVKEPSLSNKLGNNISVDNTSEIGEGCSISFYSSIAASTIGRHVRIPKNCIVNKSIIHNHVSLEDDCIVDNSVISSYSYLGIRCNVVNTSIGKFCSIAQNLLCGAGNHPTHMISTSPLFYMTYPVCNTTFATETVYHGHLSTTIGNDVWIGANVFIKSGVVIGNGSVIAAGAVVIKDVAPYSIVGGIPAQEIRKRYSELDIATLEKLRWWDWPAEDLRAATSIIQEGNVAKLQEWKAKHMQYS